MGFPRCEAPAGDAAILALAGAASAGEVAAAAGVAVMVASGASLEAWARRHTSAQV